MTTPRARALVSTLSLVSALAAPLALGACARGVAPAAFDDGVAPARRLAIEFENEAYVQVDVYLVTDRQEWRLGRVAPGARTTLAIPPDAMLTTQGFARLAALPDAPRVVQAARDPRAAVTMSQPMSDLLGQRWSFWHPQLGSARLLGADMRVARRKADKADAPRVAGVAQGASANERPPQ